MAVLLRRMASPPRSIRIILSTDQATIWAGRTLTNEEILGVAAGFLPRRSLAQLELALYGPRRSRRTQLTVAAAIWTVLLAFAATSVVTVQAWIHTSNLRRQQVEAGIPPPQGVIAPLEGAIRPISKRATTTTTSSTTTRTTIGLIEPPSSTSPPTSAPSGAPPPTTTTSTTTTTTLPEETIKSRPSRPPKTTSSRPPKDGCNPKLGCIREDL